MSWLDGALLVAFVVFLGVGARLGSLWTAAALAGGFVGAMLADFYALPLADHIGAFPGSVAIAGVALFLLGAAALILPGIILSRVLAGLLLGVVDSAFGLITGGVAGLIFVASFLLIAVPAAPEIESTRAWKESGVVRPLHGVLESLMQGPRFRRRAFGLGAAKAGMRELEPLRRKAESEIKEAAERVTGR